MHGLIQIFLLLSSFCLFNTLALITNPKKLGFLASLTCEHGFNFVVLNQGTNSTASINLKLNYEDIIGLEKRVEREAIPTRNCNIAVEHLAVGNKKTEKTVRFLNNYVTEWIIDNKHTGIEHLVEFWSSDSSKPPYVFPFGLNLKNVKKYELDKNEGSVAFTLNDGTKFLYNKLEVYDANKKLLKSEMTLKNGILYLTVLQNGKFPILIDPFVASEYPVGKLHPQASQYISLAGTDPKSISWWWKGQPDGPNSAQANQNEWGIKYGNYGSFFGAKVDFGHFNQIDKCDVVVGAPRDQKKYSDNPNPLTSPRGTGALDWEVDFHGKILLYENGKENSPIDTTPPQKFQNNRCNSAHWGFNWKISKVARKGIHENNEVNAGNSSNDGFDNLYTFSHTCRLIHDVFGKKSGGKYDSNTKESNSDNERFRNMEIFETFKFYLGYQRPAENNFNFCAYRELGTTKGIKRIMRTYDAVADSDFTPGRAVLYHFQFGWASATHSGLPADHLFIGDYGYHWNRIGRVHYFQAKAQTNNELLLPRTCNSAGSVAYFEPPEKQFDSQFGKTLLLVDLYNDGNPALLIAAPQFNSVSASAAGKVYIYPKIGNTWENVDSNNLAYRSLEGSVALGQFGFAMADLGDITFDTRRDIAISAPYEARNGDYNPRVASGAVYIYKSMLRNGNNPILVLHQKILPDDKKVRLFGYSIAGGCDHNGDSIPDIVIGAPGSGDELTDTLASLTNDFDEIGQVFVLNSKEYADVEVTLDVSKTIINAGEPLAVTAKIKNLGPKDANVEFKLTAATSDGKELTPTATGSNCNLNSAKQPTEYICTSINKLADKAEMSVTLTYAISKDKLQPDFVSFTIVNELNDLILVQKTEQKTVDIKQEVDLKVIPRLNVTDVNSAEQSRLYAHDRRNNVATQAGNTNAINGDCTKSDNCEFINQAGYSDISREEEVFLCGPAIVNKNDQNAHGVKVIFTPNPSNAVFLGVMDRANIIPATGKLVNVLPSNPDLEFSCIQQGAEVHCALKKTLGKTTFTNFDRFYLRFRAYTVNAATLSFGVRLTTSSPNVAVQHSRFSNTLKGSDSEQSLTVAFIDSTGNELTTPVDEIVGTTISRIARVVNLGSFSASSCVVTVDITSGVLENIEVYITKYSANTLGPAKCAFDVSTSKGECDAWDTIGPSDTVQVVVSGKVKDLKNRNIQISATVTTSTKDATSPAPKKSAQCPLITVKKESKIEVSFNAVKSNVYPTEIVTRQIRVLNRGPGEFEDGRVKVELAPNENFVSCTETNGTSVPYGPPTGKIYTFGGPVAIPIPLYKDLSYILKTTYDQSTITATSKTQLASVELQNQVDLSSDSTPKSDSTVTLKVGVDLALYSRTTSNVNLLIDYTNGTASFEVANTAIGYDADKYRVQFNLPYQVYVSNYELRVIENGKTPVLFDNSSSYVSCKLDTSAVSNNGLIFGDCNVTCGNNVDQPVPMSNKVRNKLTLSLYMPQLPVDASSGNFSSNNILQMGIAGSNPAQIGTSTSTIVATVPLNILPSKDPYVLIGDESQRDDGYAPGNKFAIIGSFGNYGAENVTDNLEMLITWSIEYVDHLDTAQEIQEQFDFCAQPAAIVEAVGQKTIKCTLKELIGAPFKNENTKEFQYKLNLQVKDNISNIGKTFDFTSAIEIKSYDVKDTNNRIGTKIFQILPKNLDLSLKANTPAPASLLLSENEDSSQKADFFLTVRNTEMGNSPSNKAEVKCDLKDYFHKTEATGSHNIKCSIDGSGKMTCNGFPSLLPSEGANISWSSYMRKKPSSDNVFIRCTVTDTEIDNITILEDKKYLNDNKEEIMLGVSKSAPLLGNEGASGLDIVLIIILACVAGYIIINGMIIGVYAGFFKRSEPPKWDELDNDDADELQLHDDDDER